MSRRWRLILASLAFVAWLSYLGYAALTKNRGPVISHAQAAAAPYAVVAVVNEEDGRPAKQVKVAQTLTKHGPKDGAEIDVENLPRATSDSGFSGPGEYLLFLSEPPYTIVGQQRSPGNDLSGVGPPLVYRWSDDIRKQFEKMPKRIEPPG